MPFIIPVLHGEKGVFVDTLIFDPNLMSSMFSFTRSYFMVEAEVPSQVVSFLSSVIPHKKSMNSIMQSALINMEKHCSTEIFFII